MRDSPRHKLGLEAAHRHARGPSEQWSRLDSIVSSLLSQAEDMQPSHPSASFPLSLCGPACPYPTTHQWPCVQLRKTPFTHVPGAPCRHQGLLHPGSPQPLLQFSVLPSPSQRFVSDPFRMLQLVLCRGKGKNWCSLPYAPLTGVVPLQSKAVGFTGVIPDLYLYVWGQNLPRVNLQVSYA